MEEFQKYFFQTTFHHHFQARKAKISPLFHFDQVNNGRICHILCVKRKKEKKQISVQYLKQVYIMWAAFLISLFCFKICSFSKSFVAGRILLVSSLGGFICTFSLLISPSITLPSSKFMNQFTISSKYFDMVCYLKQETYSGLISFEIQ